MKPAAFDYVRAESIDEALDVLQQEGTDACILAGGQTLIPLLSMRMARPRVVIDIMRLPGLGSSSRRDDGTIRVGATVRQARRSNGKRISRPGQPLLAAALPWVGHAQTRSRGTVCGSVAYADPSAELPLVLVALGGEIELRSRRRSRRVAAETFFTGIMSTDRNDDELIEAVRFPAARAGTGYAFREIGRRHGDFAIVACAAMVDARTARLAVGGVADRPVARDAAAPGRSRPRRCARCVRLGPRCPRRPACDCGLPAQLVRRLGRQTLEEAARCRA